MEEHKGTVITLSSLWNIVVKRWIILLLALIVGVGAGVLTSYMTYKAIYTTEIVYLVGYEGEFGSSSDLTNANNAYIVIARVLPNCVTVVSQNKYYKTLADNFNTTESESKGKINLTADNVKASLSYSYTETTTEIHVDVKTYNAQLSYDIAKAVVATFDDYVRENYPLTATSTLSCRLINIPEKATNPSNSRGTAGMAIGFGLGAFALVYIVFLLIMVADDRIKSENDITSRYKTPVISSIPKFEHANDFSVIESFRTLAVGAKFVLPETAKGNVICVTSACPAEGKTTVAINYAKACATMGAKVVVIDCDLRRPMLLETLGVGHLSGLSEYLSGSATFENIVKKDVVNNMDVIGCGKIVPNPIVVFNSKAFKALIDKLSNEYDLVILDTPPLDVVSDALTILPNTDGALVVTSEGICTNKALARVMQNISLSGSTAIGFVYNGVKVKSKDKYYGYGV